MFVHFIYLFILNFLFDLKFFLSNWPAVSTEKGSIQTYIHTDIVDGLVRKDVEWEHTNIHTLDIVDGLVRIDVEREARG